MGVYIPNMEMPKDGFITITVTSDGRVVGNSKKESGKFGYLDNEDIAKAVPVPPHGELIERDPILDVMRKERDRISETYGPNDDYVNCLNKYAIRMVTSAKTIIPAEEGKK